MINWWKLKASEQEDPFIKFFILYMCIDAWMTSESGADSNVKKLSWLTETDNPLRSHWPTTPHIKSAVSGLAKIGSVEYMRPSHRGEYVELNNKGDFKQVVLFIYQIRCNLFHGGKSPVNTHDKRLVTLSAKVLTHWLEWTLAKTR